MASEEITVNVTDATHDKEIGSQWKNGSTLVTLTPDDTKSKADMKSTGMWRSAPSGSEIRGSGGTKEHARYEWDKQDTLDLIVVGFTEGDSTKKIPPETVLTLKNFDKLMGQSGKGSFFYRRSDYAVTWEIVAPTNPNKDTGRRFVGKLTAEEMITYLVGILGEHPELRRLMAATVLSEQRLTSATLEALGEWERTFGRRVVWKSEAELVKRTGDPENLMTLQGKELWINEQAKVLKVAKRFHQEVVHELAADSLGIRGTGMAKTYLELQNGQIYSDTLLLENGILKGDLEATVRFFAGK